MTFVAIIFMTLCYAPTLQLLRTFKVTLNIPKEL